MARKAGALQTIVALSSNWRDGIWDDMDCPSLHVRHPGGFLVAPAPTYSRALGQGQHRHSVREMATLFSVEIDTKRTSHPGL